MFISLIKQMAKRKDLDCNLESNEIDNVNDEETDANQAVNENHVNPKARKKRKIMERNEFTYEMKMLEKKGVLKLDPKVMNINANKPYDEGQHVTCLMCQCFRPFTDGLINLRRPYYDYYYFKHTQHKAHMTAKTLHDSREKIKNRNDGSKHKSYTQSMISSFLVNRVKKRTTIAAATNNNNQINATNTTPCTIPTNDAPSTDNQSVNVPKTAERER